MDVFLGGAGAGKRSSRARFAEKFSQNGGLRTALFGVIYYMLSSGGFAAACLQDIAKGVSSILGRVRCFRLQQLVDLFTLLTTVEGLLLLGPPGLHGVVGMMFMHMRSMFLYVICLLHVYVCYMSLALELDMLFVVFVVCLRYVICCCLLLFVICL